MALRHVSTAPTADDFTPLQEHQAQTPTTFFGGKPVLYAQQAGLTLSVQASKLPTHAVFEKFTTVAGDQTDDVLIQHVELWASSECVSFPSVLQATANVHAATSSSSSTPPPPPASQSPTPPSPSTQP